MEALWNDGDFESKRRANDVPHPAPQAVEDERENELKNALPSVGQSAPRA